MCVPFTSTQQSTFIWTGKVVHLTVFPMYCPKPALLTRTLPTVTHSATTAVHIRPICSAVPSWIWILNLSEICALLLAGAMLKLGAWRLVVVMTVSRLSTSAVTFRVNPDDSGLVVTDRADHYFDIFIFIVTRAGAQANCDIEVDLYGKTDR